MGISSGEILIVFIVALLVMQPAEIPVLLRKIFQFKRYISNIFTDVTKAAHNLVSDIDKNVHDSELDEMNLYLKKIMQWDEQYQGEYNLASVKRHYHKLLLSHGHEQANQASKQNSK